MEKITITTTSTVNNGIEKQTLTLGNIFDKTNLTEDDFTFKILMTFLLKKRNTVNFNKINISEEMETVSNALDLLFASVNNGKFDNK